MVLCLTNTGKCDIPCTSPEKIVNNYDKFVGAKELLFLPI